MGVGELVKRAPPNGAAVMERAAAETTTGFKKEKARTPRETETGHEENLESRSREVF